jgi:hypothetical protein
VKGIPTVYGYYVLSSTQEVLVLDELPSDCGWRRLDWDGTCWSFCQAWQDLADRGYFVCAMTTV